MILLCIIILGINLSLNNYVLLLNNQIFGGKIHMKYMEQFLLIMVFSFIGEALNFLLPLPIPASIYGMLLLFGGLLSGFIKIDSVKETGKFLIEIMPVMFIPAGVGLMTSWGTLQQILVPVLVITAVSTVVVMVATGKLSQWIITKNKEVQ